MVDCNTLYLRNLPRRPRSNANFTRLLLKRVNEGNSYVKDPSLPIPRNETVGNADLQLLDDKHGIVELSRSVKLQNQCFITFIDAHHATQFKEQFQSRFEFNGRTVDIHYAEKNSLLGLAQVNQDQFESVLKRRRLRQRLLDDEALGRQHRLKRKLRRVRCKLRAKGLAPDEVQKIIETIQDVAPAKAKPSKPLAKEAVISGNPPNKVLLVQNLPNATTLASTTDLFQSPALVEVRLVAVRNLAFVEYKTIEDAASMRTKLGSQHDWDGHPINIEFAK